MNKTMAKPTTRDFVDAVIQTQSEMIYLYIIALAFIPFGILASSDFFYISAVFAFLGYLKWITSYNTLDRIKTKAFVIACKRPQRTTEQ